MTGYEVHTIESAPHGSREPLRSLAASVGFIPNLAAAMAESPQLLRGFLAVRDLYRGGTFTPAEIQVLSLTAAFENGCAWCMAFHTGLALKDGVTRASVDALRAGKPPLEPKSAALSDFARALVQKRGAVAAEELDRFCSAGYTRAQALEVVLGMAFSLMANYSGHLAHAPLNAPFQPHAWQRP